jgi:hypothetical protein
MTYAKIGKILKVTPGTVRNILALGPVLPAPEEETKATGRSKLKREHILFLTMDETLNDWAQKTLSERCVLFHRRYPEVKISRAYLSHIYKVHGVKLKRINFVKRL